MYEAGCSFCGWVSDKSMSKKIVKDVMKDHLRGEHIEQVRAKYEDNRQKGKKNTFEQFLGMRAASSIKNN